MSKRALPEINAGSMADIAFLLLIFFLVTTTMSNDLGILKRLPERITDHTPVNIKQRNIFEIAINHNDKLMVEDSREIDFKNLKQQLIDFIDNGAGFDTNGNPCDWCDGKKDQTSSEHPAKAVIALASGRNTSYGAYLTVQNEINAAYNELRNKLSLSLYGITFKQLENDYQKDKSNISLKEKIAHIKAKYPVLISEIPPEK